MTQILTTLAIALAAGWAMWRLQRAFRRDSLSVRIRLDREAPGAHLIWDVTNVGRTPVTIAKLMVHGRRGAPTEIALDLPKVLEPSDRVLLPTDVDWTLLAARMIAVVDAHGREHFASARELANVQDHLRQLIDRRVYSVSARDWLFGATDLAFGVVILGLGFFMLMWVIATG